ncbi:glutamate receptor ionotropic, kainate 5-like isoform X2 [Hyalella azteca]|uniref:Glutamate receptor ionotropic, kainate 5-like isoform X1 n=1 Tax=Hyalella azteca TaxID=294128 RepID=A0A979FNJ1_HYAAZ|nr:glutamate receptor ionotropic, kainate 5-like isoform X1 [Hyalella azteca]XP_047738634.1 glutamate receptor ionotropic, kainate 5-like isoform X2 [Hyalella azteca]
MPTDLALVYDAVQLFARALSDLDKTRAIEVLPLNCSKEQVWPLGATLVNYIKWVSQVLQVGQSSAAAQLLQGASLATWSHTRQLHQVG